MLLWFVGTAVVAVWYVFRDPGFDYRLLVVGALAPDLVDVWFGGARVLHSVTASVALLAAVMACTRRGGRARHLLLPLPIGTFLHLVFDGAWADSRVFWWPLLGTSFDGARLPVVERGVWSLVLEAVGVALVVWTWRTACLSQRSRQAELAGTGRLGLPGR